MMRQISEDEGLIRKYLLGELPEAEQKDFEQLFFLDPSYREKALIIENELIEDYLDGALTEQERKKFTTYFLSTPQQLRKLRIAKAIKKFIVVEMDDSLKSSDNEISPQEDVQRNSIGWLNWRNPFVAVPAATALIIVLVFCAFKLIEIQRLSNQRKEEQSRRKAIEQELAKINGQASASSKQIFPIVLSSINTREAQARGQISRPANATVIELQLVLVGEKYMTYSVLLQKPGESEPYTIHQLHAETTKAGQAVAVKLPAHILTPGDYQLQLLGVTATSDTERVGEYDFQITDRPNP